jgi:hypothetical protein
VRSLSLALLCVLAATPTFAEPLEDPSAPAPDDGRLSVLVLDLQRSNVEPGEVRIVTDLIATQIGRRDNIDVLTASDLADAMGLEAERQAMGCESNESCLAEIAGAMGADLVVFGSVGRLNQTFLVNLNLFSNAETKSVARETVEANDLDELPRAIAVATDRMIVAAIPDAESMIHEPAPAATPLMARPLAWVGIGGLAVGGVVALVGGGLAAWQYSEFQSARSQEKWVAARSGIVAGGVVAAVGAVVLVAGGGALGAAAVLE